MVEELIKVVKPGTTYSEVRKIELKMYEGTGYEPVIPYTGHNVGRVVHEPPYLMEGEDTVLAPGMVLTVEPTVMYQGDGDIFISLEDTLLVTENGCECLTESATLDLYL
jgi:Xaa-Pro aminopeptidase